VQIDKKSRVCINLAAFIFFVAFIISCSNIQRNKSHNHVPVESITKGKALAITYCQSCHVLPDPSWVDARTWQNGILPNMGPRLGIFHYNQKTYPSFRFDGNLSKGYYPEKPLITDEDWQHIIDYYTSVSPDSVSMDQHRQHPIQNKSLKQFEAISPPVKYPVPATCFVKINELDSLEPVIITDAHKQMIYGVNRNLEYADSIKTKGPVVNIELNNGGWVTCNIGILNPNNGKFGSAEAIKTTSGKNMKGDSTVLFDHLRRPVQVTPADLNHDGKEDYLVCEFGFLEGSLSWMENVGNDKYIPHVLRPLPGAIKAYVQDYNNDGLEDIWALFTQGEEGIFLFTNQGKGTFKQEEVLRFPPINGSSYFELADFNKDGHPDIVYTCGDNADYSAVLKPFHGVYIYMNDGKNRFTKKYFFPINGCYKAIARDYDKDGDLDIAAISYFADYERQPEEGFVYLENKGHFDFMPHSTPAAESGRWLTMDAGDFNNDGWIDLILGNFSVAPSFIPSKIDWKTSPPFMILKNMGKKASE
jgi:hypothetical protein